MTMRILLVLFVLAAVHTGYAQSGFTLTEVKKKKKVEVRYDGKLLTAYCYFDSTEKPVLFPIKTVSGITVTRGYPIAPRAGERTDHPHHVGLWFNYESVNGLDFWNNSTAIPAAKKSQYGSIRHQKVLDTKVENGNAVLRTLSHWVDPTGKVLLEETTEFTFRKKDNNFIIDRSATLKAMVPEVVFKDVKDGMLGLRVARALEMPSGQEDKFVDNKGNVTTVAAASTAGVTGMYVNRDAVRGDDTWAKRSDWTILNGEKDGEKISIAIIDHTKNPGYPTYWHARGYGLFAANPLGQKVFSNGKEEMNFKLAKDNTATFVYRVVIHSGSELSAMEADGLMWDFRK